jgi:hypothetical protein
MNLKLPEIKDIDINVILKSNRINYGDKYKIPPVLMYLKQGENEYPIMHKGSFSAIKGQSKGRKTTLMTIIASAYANKPEYLLSTFVVPNSNEKDCLYIDTEQAGYESHRMIKRIELLTGNSKRIIYFNLREYSPDERREIIDKLLEQFKDKIELLFIDGVLDLVTEMNSEIQGSDLTSWMLRVTTKLDIHISCVIHENFGGEKAAGHVGSSILRRAETIISVNLKKGNRNFSVVAPDRMRGEHFSPFEISINRDDLPYIQESNEPDF